jgi:hypothetical protein
MLLMAMTAKIISIVISIKYHELRCQEVIENFNKAEKLFFIIVDIDDEVMKKETIPMHSPQSDYSASYKASSSSNLFITNV